jgi:hypothetical protein
MKGENLCEEKTAFNALGIFTTPIRLNERINHGNDEERGRSTAHTG